LGFKSLASILPETSIAITISIPLVVFVWLLISTVLGRAIAIINELNANNRKTNKKGFSFARIDFEFLNPLTELIFNVGVSCFRFQKFQKITTGSNKNNQKNSAFKKEISFIIIALLV
jgi:hypothetical protein